MIRVPRFLRLSSLLLAAAPQLALPTSSDAQVAEATTAWTFTAGQSIEWLRFLPSGPLVVSADDGLRAIDPATGQVLWTRSDLGNVSQATYEGSQQGTPMSSAGGGAPAAGATIRVMEELPGGKLMAILADSAGRHSWFDVVDVATGTTRWSSTALPIGEAHGFLPFPDSTSLLVYGLMIEPGRSRRLWARVDAASGQVRWVSDSLLLEIPAQFDPTAMAASTGTVNGNQPLIALPDSSLLLYASADGLVRFDDATGRVRWRVRMSSAELAPIGQGYAPMVVSGDTAYLPAWKSVEAVDLTAGRRLWATPGFSTMTTQLVATKGGLLVRGVPNLLAGQDPRVIKPLAALVDAATGKPRWKTDWGARTGVTPFLVEGDAAVLASDKGMLRLQLSTATADTVGKAEKLPGRPAASLEPWEGGLLLSAAQSLTLYEPDGAVRYQQEYPAPTMSLGGRLLRVALGAAAIAGGVYYSGGYLAGSAFAHYQYSHSACTSAYTYFVLKDHNGTGPALGRIDKNNGKLVGVIGLAGDKTPEYVISQVSGQVVIKQDKTLTAWRW